jgi:hypothetical protein
MRGSLRDECRILGSIFLSIIPGGFVKNSLISLCLLLSLAVCLICAAPVALAQEPANANHAPIHYDRPFGKTAVAPQAPTGSQDALPKFHLVFHGGPVQTKTTSYAIYWKPSGSYMNKDYQKIINQFLKDVGGSPIYAYATEYSGSNGKVEDVSKFGGSWVDTTPFPAGGLTDKAIMESIERGILFNGWTTGVNSSFFLMLGAGPQVGACAYHSAFQFNGDNVIYGVMPYFTIKNAGGCGTPFGITPNNNFDADSTIGNLTHEQMEMVTDPLLNAWYDNKYGVEVGDVCIYSYGVPFASNGGNLVAKGHQYIIQEEWSEKNKACQPNL